jgi:hypothetical protein
VRRVPTGARLGVRSLPQGRFFNFQQGRPAVRLTATQNRTGARYEFPASVLLLSSRCMVALRFENLPGYDGAACGAPRLLCALPSAVHLRRQSLQEAPPVIFPLILSRAEGSGHGRQRHERRELPGPFACQTGGQCDGTRSFTAPTSKRRARILRSFAASRCKRSHRRCAHGICRFKSRTLRRSAFAT